MSNPAFIARGESVRDQLVRELLCDLRPGSVVPKDVEAACLLGVDPTMAGRHLRRAMDECGFTIGRLPTRRRVVVEAPIPGLLMMGSIE